MRKVIEEIVDDGEYLEVHERWATNIICALSRLDGHVVGIVANQPQSLAGVLDIEASEKAARFVQLCDAFNIPIVTLLDVPGFLPGVDQEHGGIIRHGAKLLYAYCNATVPRISIVLRKAYGGAYIVMDSQSIGADLTYAWPTNEIAVMGAEGAANVIFRKQIAEADDPEAMRVRMVKEYKSELMHPYYAAERGLVDDVIDPVRDPSHADPLPGRCCAPSTRTCPPASTATRPSKPTATAPGTAPTATTETNEREPCRQHQHRPDPRGEGSGQRGRAGRPDRRPPGPRGAPPGHRPGPPGCHRRPLAPPGAPVRLPRREQLAALTRTAPAGASRTRQRPRTDEGAGPLPSCPPGPGNPAAAAMRRHRTGHPRRTRQPPPRAAPEPRRPTRPPTRRRGPSGPAPAPYPGSRQPRPTAGAQSPPGRPHARHPDDRDRDRPPTGRRAAAIGARHASRRDRSPGQGGLCHAVGEVPWG